MPKINVSNKPVKFITTDNEKVPQRLSATGSLIVTEQQYTNSSKANFVPAEAYSYIGIFLGGEHVVSGYGQPTADIRDTLTYVAYNYASDIDGLASYLYSAYAYTLDYIDSAYNSLFNDIVDLNTYVTDSYAYTIDYVNNVYSYTIDYVNTLNNEIWAYTQDAYAYTLGYIATSYATMYAYTTYHGENITYLLDNKEYTNFSNTYTISELFEASLIKPEYKVPKISNISIYPQIIDISSYSVPKTFKFSAKIAYLTYLVDNKIPTESGGLIENISDAKATIIKYKVSGQNEQTIHLSYLTQDNIDHTISYTVSIQFNNIPDDLEHAVQFQRVSIAYKEANDGYYEPLASNGINITYTGGKFGIGHGTHEITNTYTVAKYPIVYVYGDDINNLTVNRLSTYYNTSGYTYVTIPFDEGTETTYIGVAYPNKFNYDCLTISGNSYFLSTDAFGTNPLDNNVNVFAYHNETCTYGTSNVEYKILYAVQANNRKFSGIKEYKVKITK